MLMDLKPESGTSTVSFTPERVEQLVRSVLIKRFPGDHERQHVSRQGVRLNFCCPYCGDSHDARKKRGNMYTHWLYFKCYNGGCEKYTDLEWFLRNFECADLLSDEERTALKVHIIDEKKNSRFEKIKNFELNLQMLVEAKWDRLLMPRAELMKRLRLWDINEKCSAYAYLSKRLQVVDERFAWDNYRKRLFIFNLDKTGQWVFGLQVKQMDDPSARYKTYTAEKCWDYFMGEKEAGLLEYASGYNHLSTLFGILRVDMYRTVTLFEGPLDHFLYPNSVATCSINNDWPLDLDNKRWFQDNDDAGRAKALEYLGRGDQVFLWKTMFDQRPELYGSKRKDYNDIYLNGFMRGVQVGALDEFFSNHKHDGIFL